MKSFFSAQWDAMNPRERLLISVAVGLITILLILVIVIRPALSFQQSQRDAFDRAFETALVVQRAVAAGKAAQNDDDSSLRSILTSTATQNGIVINRINVQEGAIDLSVANTTIARLYGWLDRLERDQNVYVQEGSLRPSNDGLAITARLTMAKGA
ncbi:MAG: type II secretion system protein GspM [Pseudomonadota bacterium]